MQSLHKSNHSTDQAKAKIDVNLQTINLRSSRPTNRPSPKSAQQLQLSYSSSVINELSYNFNKVSTMTESTALMLMSKPRSTNKQVGPGRVGRLT